jgi:hypothetical protein
MRKERVVLLESMNVIVAERMSFFDNFIHSHQLGVECRKHIFPVYTPNPKYSSLQLAKISGSLVFLFSLLCLSVFVLVGEIVFDKFSVKEAKVAEKSYEIQLCIDDKIEVGRRISYTEYLEFLEIIEKRDFVGF